MIYGRHIYNYPSRSSMKRGGWQHFSIIAKDSSLYKAVEVCKSWDEFFEPSTLALHRFFPSPECLSWSGEFVRRQDLQICKYYQTHMPIEGDICIRPKIAHCVSLSLWQVYLWTCLGRTPLVTMLRLSTRHPRIPSSKAYGRSVLNQDRISSSRRPQI